MNKQLGNYNLSIEAKWQEIWQKENIYKWNENELRENIFVIDTPPPTISGELHMGHMYSYNQADFIARYQRMKGKEVFYPIGFDDNGLPTERLVEKKKNIRANNMTRAEFISICQEVVGEVREEFRTLFKSIALSVDWSQEYQTINQNSVKISQYSFLDLLTKDKIYRKLQPSLWDPIDQTALAQADIVDKEQIGVMNDIIFTLEDSTKLTIATTRPELLPACVAIFYNPKDSRYTNFINKFAITPLFKIKVPILADESVDIEKGTGLVMCCTFGDITDTHWYNKYNLELRIILDKAGKIINLDEIIQNNSIDVNYAKSYASQLTGLKITPARAKILELLKENNLISKQAEVNQVVKCAERSGAPLEILVTNQWFVKLLDNKELFLEKTNECTWHPNYMKVRLENWINGLNWDWCISRQRFFGVPFPIWYSKRQGEEGKILTPHISQLPVDPFTDLPFGYNKDEVEPDPDVMDTWATSSISPQLSSHAISKEFSIDYKRHEKLFPADLRPQGHDIIRTWAFYTIVKSAYHENTIPWKNLMINGWCLASDKTKMSKSKGNAISPVKLIEERGADAVRYWASTFKLGADTAYSLDVFNIGKKLINKIWNASKFTSLHLEKISDKILSAKVEIEKGDIYCPIDLWALSHLSKTITLMEKEFEKFEYSNARSLIENYFWNIFCDNYLELIKVRIYDQNNTDPKASISAIKTSYICLSTILKLFAPFIPFVTEEIYRSLFEDNSIHRKGNWPNPNDYNIDYDMEVMGDKIINILDIVRKVKAEKELSLKTLIKQIVIYTNFPLSKDIINDLQNVTNSEEIILKALTEQSLKDNQYQTNDKEFVIEINI